MTTSLSFSKVKMFSLMCSIVAGGCALEGCSNSSPVYYTLMHQDGAFYNASLGTARIIKIFAPSVPEKLDRDAIVLSGQAYRMKMDDAAAWSESLSTMIGHTLAQDVAQRLPGRIVFSQNDSVTVPPQVNISLSINRFDINADQRAVVDGILSIQRAGETSDMAQSVPVHWVSSGHVRYAAQPLAEALSQGVGAIADQAAQALSTLQVR